MPGHGFLITRYPFFPDAVAWPFSSTTAISVPGIGLVAEPGFSEIVSSPGSGESIIPPVSVCHHVSTIGHFDFPIIVKYQRHTSGFIGSPTVPKSLSEERSNELGSVSPNFINILNAVGVV